MDYSPIGGKALNVVLVSVDTTRADHIGCYGHPEIETPNLDRLAAEGTRFAQAISAAPLTLPSHATMLTGSAPFVHGARDNGIFVVAPENRTLAEIFAEAGYATHAEVAALVLGRRYGLDQGFATYGEAHRRVRQAAQHPVPRSQGDPALEGDLGQIEVKSAEVELDRKAEEITRSAIELLGREDVAKGPFFLFLHYFDPHWPYEAPEPYARRYRDPYLAEIAYFDHWFGELMRALRDLGHAEDTLVVLTSDHGEGRGQHGELTHSSFLYDSTLHVPLILWAPGRIPAGRVIETQVRLLDLAPTLVDFTRLEATAQMQGRSLLPLVADPDLELRLPAYSDTLVPKHTFGYSPLRSLRVDGWKYVLAPRPELYRLSDDPGELFNLVRAEPDRAARMKEELRALVAASPQPLGTAGGSAVPDEEELRKLAALGYVSSAALRDSGPDRGSELDHFEPTGVNPRDRVELVDLWATGLGSLRVGDWTNAEKIFRRFVELEPELAAGASHLGRALTMLDRADEAIEMFRRAIELEPSSYLDHRALANLLAARGDYDEARSAYRNAIGYYPEDMAARLNLALLEIARGAHSEALEQLDAVIATAPDLPDAHLQRGVCLRLTGRPAEAVASLEEALRLDPSALQAHAELALARFDLGQRQAAIAGLEAAIEATPGAPLLIHRLAELQSASDRLDAAGASFARVVELLPDNALAHQNLGFNLLMRRRPAEAIPPLARALELDPSAPEARFYLARALAETGSPGRALDHLRRLLAELPAHVPARAAAAELLVRRGEDREAIDLLERGIESTPEDATLLNDLAWYLATTEDPSLHDGERAVRLAERAVARADPGSFNELDTLSVAYADVGRFEEAVIAAERALALAREHGAPELASSIAARLELFRQAKAHR